jgi:hypothetical protein
LAEPSFLCLFKQSKDFATLDDSTPSLNDFPSSKFVPEMGALSNLHSPAMLLDLGFGLEMHGSCLWVHTTQSPNNEDPEIEVLTYKNIFNGGAKFLCKIISQSSLYLI